LAPGLSASNLQRDNRQRRRPALQGMTGIAFRWRHFGIYTELKYERAEVEDAAGEAVDVSGTGLFAGVSVQF
jgi:hypothetical protein